jgi:transposase-like protein
MNYQEVLHSAQLLSKAEKLKLAGVLLGHPSVEDHLSVRKDQLYNRQTGCPHCQGTCYYKYGKESGSQRFKCKTCGRTFTEYTGTWLAGVHKKDLVSDYLALMVEQKSLDKISHALSINKKTAFDWRHKILSSTGQDSASTFTGIIESDETFFARSEKGSLLDHPGRKRGSLSGRRGISDEKVAVIVTADRKGSMNMAVSTMGRISKTDIATCMEGGLMPGSVLCTDGHVSYKGFAMDNKLEHIVLRADLKQHVKQGIYHIQHVNSLHHRLKKWIDNTFWGVSTKYLQNCLNWFRLNERLKNSVDAVHDLAYQSLQDTHALKRFRYIDFSFQTLIATLN